MCCELLQLKCGTILNFPFRVGLLLIFLYNLSKTCYGGQILHWDFSVESPNVNFIRSYVFLFQLETSINANEFYIRIDFPYQIHVSLKSEVAINVYLTNCEADIKETELLFTSQSEDFSENPVTGYISYIFKIKQVMHNSKKFKMFLKPTKAPINAGVFPPISIYTMSQPTTAADAIYYDSNLAFSSFSIVADPPNSLIVIMTSVTPATGVSIYQVSSSYRGFVEILPKITRDTGLSFFLTFSDLSQDFRFKGVCNNIASSTGYILKSSECTVMNKGEYIRFRYLDAMISSQPFKIEFVVQNPDKVDRTATLQVYSIHENNVWILETGSSSNSFNSVASKIMTVQTNQLHWGVTGELFHLFVCLNDASKPFSYNNFKIAFQVNNDILDSAPLGLKIGLPKASSIVEGAINHNFPIFPNTNLLVELTDRSTDKAILKLYGLGQLKKGTVYYMFFKVLIITTDTTLTKITNFATLTLFIKNIDGTESNVSLQEITATEIPVKFSEHYDSNDIVTKNINYNYIVSSVSSNVINDVYTKLRQSPPQEKVGIFVDKVNMQNFILNIFPTTSQWCLKDANCNYGKILTMRMRIFFGSHISMTNPAMEVLGDCGRIDNCKKKTIEKLSDQKTWLATLECDSFDACYNQILELDTYSRSIPRGIVLKNVQLSNPSTLYATQEPLDFIFRLEYGSSYTFASTHLFNAYFVSPTFPKKTSLLYVNYQVNDANIRSFPTLLKLRGTFADEIGSSVPTVIAIFFDLNVNVVAKEPGCGGGSLKSEGSLIKQCRYYNVDVPTPMNNNPVQMRRLDISLTSFTASTEYVFFIPVKIMAAPVSLYVSFLFVDSVGVEPLTAISNWRIFSQLPLDKLNLYFDPNLKTTVAITKEDTQSVETNDNKKLADMNYGMVSPDYDDSTKVFPGALINSVKISCTHKDDNKLINLPSDFSYGSGFTIVSSIDLFKIAGFIFGTNDKNPCFYFKSLIDSAGTSALYNLVCCVDPTDTLPIQELTVKNWKINPSLWGQSLKPLIYYGWSNEKGVLVSIAREAKTLASTGMLKISSISPLYLKTKSQSLSLVMEFPGTIACDSEIVDDCYLTLILEFNPKLNGFNGDNKVNAECRFAETCLDIEYICVYTTTSVGEKITVTIKQPVSLEKSYTFKKELYELILFGLNLGDETVTNTKIIITLQKKGVSMFKSPENDLKIVPYSGTTAIKKNRFLFSATNKEAPAEIQLRFKILNRSMSPYHFLRLGFQYDLTENDFLFSKCVVIDSISDKGIMIFKKMKTSFDTPSKTQNIDLYPDKYISKSMMDYMEIILFCTWFKVPSKDKPQAKIQILEKESSSILFESKVDEVLPDGTPTVSSLCTASKFKIDLLPKFPNICSHFQISFTLANSLNVFGKNSVAIKLTFTYLAFVRQAPLAHSTLCYLNQKPVSCIFVDYFSVVIYSPNEDIAKSSNGAEYTLNISCVIYTALTNTIEPRLAFLIKTGTNQIEIAKLISQRLEKSDIISSSFTETCILNLPKASTNSIPPILKQLGFESSQPIFGKTGIIKLYFAISIDTLNFGYIYLSFPPFYDFNYGKDLGKIICTLIRIQNSVNYAESCESFEHLLKIKLKIPPGISFENEEKFIVNLDQITTPWISSKCGPFKIIIFTENNGNINYMSYDNLYWSGLANQGCDSSCRTCELKNDAKSCLSCPDGKLLDVLKKECTQTCQPPSVLDEINLACRVCHFSCSTCSGSTENDCYTCAQTRTKSSTKCVCNAGLVDFGVPACGECHVTCKTCSGVEETKCLECHPTMTPVVNGDKKTCVCLERKFFNSTAKACQDCHILCKRCTGPGSNQCTECFNNHILEKDGSCKCPKDTSDVGKKEDCLPIQNVCCHETCATCVGPQIDECLTCENLREPKNFICVCTDTYFEDKTSKQCKKCWTGCKRCLTDSEYTCTECTNNLILRDSSCVCQDTFYNLQIYPECFGENNKGGCNKPCKTCIEKSNSIPSLSDDCIDCKENQIYLKGNCTCKEGFYRLDDGSCEACPFPCASCTNKDTCLSCKGNHTKDECGFCNCKEGFSDIDKEDNCYEIITNRTFCNFTCTSCIGPRSDQCASCTKKSRIFNKGVCECDSSYWEVGKDECSGCHFTCETCKGPEMYDCIKCIEDGNRGDKNKTPINNLCSCPEGTEEVFKETCPAISKALQATQTTAKILISAAGVSLFPLFLIGSLGVVWKFVDIAQLLSYMTYINIEFPLNFRSFLEQLYSFNLNNLLPNFVTSIINSFQKEGEEMILKNQDPPPPFRFRKLSSSYIKNSCTIFLIQFILFTLIYLVRTVLRKRLARHEDIKSQAIQSLLKLKGFLEWSFVLQLVISNWLESMLHIFLQMENCQFSPVINLLSFFLMILALCYFFGWFYKIQTIITNEDKLEDKQIIIKYQYLWDGLKKDQASSRHFLTIGFFRKTLLTIILVFGYDEPTAEISGIIVIYSLLFLYMIITKPFEKLKMFIISVISEFLLLVLHFLFLVYHLKQEDYSDEELVNFGWAMIYLLIVLLLINVISILIEFIYGIPKMIEMICRLKNGIQGLWMSKPILLQGLKTLGDADIQEEMVKIQEEAERAKPTKEFVKVELTGRAIVFDPVKEEKEIDESEKNAKKPHTRSMFKKISLARNPDDTSNEDNDPSKRGNLQFKLIRNQETPESNDILNFLKQGKPIDPSDLSMLHIRPDDLVGAKADSSSEEEDLSVISISAPRKKGEESILSAKKSKNAYLRGVPRIEENGEIKQKKKKKQELKHLAAAADDLEYRSFEIGKSDLSRINYDDDSEEPDLLKKIQSRARKPEERFKIITMEEEIQKKTKGELLVDVIRRIDLDNAIQEIENQREDAERKEKAHFNRSEIERKKGLQAKNLSHTRSNFTGKKKYKLEGENNFADASITNMIFKSNQPPGDSPLENQAAGETKKGDSSRLSFKKQNNPDKNKLRKDLTNNNVRFEGGGKLEGLKISGKFDGTHNTVEQNFNPLSKKGGNYLGSKNFDLNNSSAALEKGSTGPPYFQTISGSNNMKNVPQNQVASEKFDSGSHVKFEYNSHGKFDNGSRGKFDNGSQGKFDNDSQGKFDNDSQGKLDYDSQGKSDYDSHGKFGIGNQNFRKGHLQAPENKEDRSSNKSRPFTSSSSSQNVSYGKERLSPLKSQGSGLASALKSKEEGSGISPFKSKEGMTSSSLKGKEGLGLSASKDKNVYLSKGNDGLTGPFSANHELLSPLNQKEESSSFKGKQGDIFNKEGPNSFKAREGRDKSKETSSNQRPKKQGEEFDASTSKYHNPIKSGRPNIGESKNRYHAASQAQEKTGDEQPEFESDIQKGLNSNYLNFFLTDEKHLNTKSTFNSSIINQNKLQMEGVCLVDTWSRGKEFFFIEAGEKLIVKKLFEEEKLVECINSIGKQGILHLEEVRLLNAEK